MKEVNPFIEEKQIYTKWLKTFPTFYQTARNALKMWKEIRCSNYSEVMSYERLKKLLSESNYLIFQEAMFITPALRKIRHDFRKHFKTSPKKIELCGAFTMQIYSDSTIQDFFEYTLFYVFLTQKEISMERAKTEFIETCKVSIGLHPNNPDKEKQLKDFLEFKNGVKGFIDTESFLRQGRPRGITSDTEKEKELAEKGMSNSQISRELYKALSFGERKTDVARIGRKMRGLGLHARTRKKTNKN